MGTIAEMLRRVSAVNLPREVPQIIKRTKDDIVKLQQEQLYEGRDAKDKPITPDYSPLTVSIKKEKGQPYDRVTLKDTGKFYKGIKVTYVKRDRFTINSKDKKDFELEDKYGPEIFGLNLPSRIIYVNEAFFPELKAYIESTTKLRMT